jgi:hypothetical protein
MSIHPSHSPVRHPVDLVQLFRDGIGQNAEARAALVHALGKTPPRESAEAYAVFYDEVSSSPLTSNSQCSQILSLADAIREFVPDGGEYLLRSFCYRACQDGFQLQLREGLCQLAVLLEGLDHLQPGMLHEITGEALNIPPGESHAQRLVTFELLLMQGLGYLGEVEPHLACAIVERIEGELPQWRQHEGLLVDPMPHEQADFELLIDLFHLKADALSQSERPEAAAECLEEVIAKLRVITVYPVTESWVEAAHVQLLTQLAEVYLEWAARIAETGQDPYANDPQLERGKAVVITALDKISKYDPGWLPATLRAELRIIESELLLELLEDEEAELALRSAAEIIHVLPERGKELEYLRERLEEGWETLEQIRGAKGDGETEEGS